MKKIRSISGALATLCIVGWSATVNAAAPESNATHQIPEALQPWETWATWNDRDRLCPTPYSDATKHLCFWLSRFGLQAERAGGKFDMVVTCFQEAWIPLPGDHEVWPLSVRANGSPVAVLEHEGYPAVRLPAGTVRLEGEYRWTDIPQRLRIPREIGILALVVDGQPVAAPVWDAQGFLWLKRDGSTEGADKNFLGVKLYAALEDGIPLWLRTEIELTVSGKSREEDLGTILPEGWKLAAVESLIPVAVDETGRMKAQVRAGKWTVQADAFRFDNPQEIRYPQGVKAAVEEQLIAFRARPDFRTVEIIGAPAVDVSQTTFPEKWRELPVYRWETGAPFRLEERLRGMGDQKPAGLTIAREMWLDENGRGLTFRDRIGGVMQQIWRLDAAAGQDLGSVRSGGKGQLITRNPQNDAPGVEIRTRNLQLEATGRMSRARELSATGWRSDADSLNVTLNLPPGWRLFALFGADWVQGDWLTAWTLLDLFLLLVFSLAVYRLWGACAGVLAFVALGLSYHEPGAPRYLWLVLIVPLALQRVVPEGKGRIVLLAGQWVAVALLLLSLVPFIARQVQQALYPQLEIVVRSDGINPVQTEVAAPDFATGTDSLAEPAAVPQERRALLPASPKMGVLSSAATLSGRSSGNENLSYDAKARIQTGPGVPEWKWRAVSFGWNGPVTAAQQVHPVLISLPLERLLTVLRVVLLLSLAGVLLGVRRLRAPFLRTSGPTMALLAIFLMLRATASAQVPDQPTLDKLRERLLEPSDAYPNAAEIPSVTLSLRERKIAIDAEVHAAIRTAVPLPGRLPAWSPVTVLIDGKPDVAMRRDDGYLWLVVEPGVHQIYVEGSLAEVTEWEWTFLLKPRHVKIEAPSWTVTGVRADGVPEAQVFFSLKQKAGSGAATYDRQEVQTMAAIDRTIELGLIWQARSVVTRLSPPGKAVALRVPLLPGENVLSSNAIVKDGFLEVRLGAQDGSFAWESSLPIGNELRLATRAEDAWVERWHLVASPIWNVTIAGLPPTFERDRNAASPGGADLIPGWQPWPGESVDLTIRRPEAIAGATLTVNRGTHEISVGSRQQVSDLDLSLRCSLGEDFLVELPAAAEITSLTHNGKEIPVRKDGGKLIIPVRPGEQVVKIGWKINTPLGFRTEAAAVRLPVESANVQTIIHVPEDRWVLWVHGPRRGPALRFWGILICSLLAAVALGRIARSPLRTFEWMLLVIGLTQVPLPAALVVVGWLFFLGWRESAAYQHLGNDGYNTLQVLLIILTAVALGILVVAVGEGLLGTPEMFILGNKSTRTVLRWFQDRSENLLPRPGCFSISIWWYRLAMLAWALWLAAALIRWLRRGWLAFTSGGAFRSRPPKKAPVPPPLPTPEAPAA